MTLPPEPDPGEAGETVETGETGEADGSEPAEPAREPRPVIERIGLAAIAVVLAALFGVVAAASWIGGEVFLAVMAGVGCLMTVWVGMMTLIRG